MHQLYRHRLLAYIYSWIVNIRMIYLYPVRKIPRYIRFQCKHMLDAEFRFVFSTFQSSCVYIKCIQLELWPQFDLNWWAQRICLNRCFHSNGWLTCFSIALFFPLICLFISVLLIQIGQSTHRYTDCIPQTHIFHLKAFNDFK